SLSKTRGAERNYQGATRPPPPDGLDATRRHYEGNETNQGRQSFRSTGLDSDRYVQKSWLIVPCLPQRKGWKLRIYAYSTKNLRQMQSQNQKLARDFHIDSLRSRFALSEPRARNENKHVRSAFSPTAYSDRARGSRW